MKKMIGVLLAFCLLTVSCMTMGGLSDVSEEDLMISINSRIAEGGDLNASNNKGETLLCMAALYGYTEAVKILIEAGADVNVKNDEALSFTPLMEATSGKNIEIMRILIDAGADLNTTTEKLTALAWAIGNTSENVEAMTVLIEAGADIHAGDITPLAMAARMGSKQSVDLLIAAGATR